MMPRMLRQVLVTAWLVAAASPAGAEMAPELPRLADDAWINSRPLELAQLRGRPVLIEFWTFGCSNCRNTLPWLKRIHERYSPVGLIVIGVHTPEFDYERGAANVERRVRQLGIAYPIMVDDDFRYWNALGNRFWPAFYLIGPDGDVVATRIGELHTGQRSADDFERQIAELTTAPATFGAARPPTSDRARRR
jgi:thiol-disulfide isomerase/thioredoxin